MSYGFDLSQISLERLKKNIQKGYLIPSMQRLREDIDRIFGILGSLGLLTVAELGQQIANQKKVEEFGRKAVELALKEGMIND